MNEDIIAKIKKLRSLSTSSDLHEATNAALMADKLLLKYRISEQEINNHLSEEVVQAEVPLYESARAISWKMDLAICLAKHYSCYIYNNCGITNNNRKLTRLILVGVKSDMEIVSYMFSWLVFEIENLNKKNKGKGHLVCNSFCSGAIVGIYEQLKASKEQSDQSDSVALVKMDLRISKAETLIRSKMKLKNDNRANHSKLLSDPFNSGISAGKNIHLGKSMNPNIKLLVG